MKYLGTFVLCIATALAGASAGAAAYPRMAPFSRYEMASRMQEIALARSAAPASISAHARILVLGERAYETAAPGGNGFVCLVERSWDLSFDDPEFWNPKIRSPECFNAAGARSVLPRYLERTRWVLAGHSLAGMRAQAAAARAAGKDMKPLPGSICFMMSKEGYLNDLVAGPWHPHVMSFALGAKPGDWGANLPGSPVAADDTSYKPVTIFMFIAPAWSDGTPDGGSSVRSRALHRAPNGKRS